MPELIQVIESVIVDTLEINIFIRRTEIILKMSVPRRIPLKAFAMCCKIELLINSPSLMVKARGWTKPCPLTERLTLGRL